MISAIGRQVMKLSWLVVFVLCGLLFGWTRLQNETVEPEPQSLYNFLLMRLEA